MVQLMIQQSCDQAWRVSFATTSTPHIHRQPVARPSSANNAPATMAGAYPQEIQVAFGGNHVLRKRVHEAIGKPADGFPFAP